MNISHKQYQRFAGYYEEYFDQVYRYTYFRTGRNKDIAFDLASEVFLKALEKFHTYQEEKSAFRNWIFTIARNHIIDYYRIRKVDVNIDDVSQLLVAPETIAKKLGISNDTAIALCAMEHLPEPQQEILHLKFFAELSNQEIAKVLEKTEINVRVILHRAIHTLKQKITTIFSPQHVQNVTRTQLQGIITPETSFSS